jgi:hypothetical protein
MLLVTIYALIGDDIRLLAAGKDSDIVFTWFNVLTLTLFSVELILSCIGVEGYFGSFFFWLDLISTISIVLDIEPLADVLLNFGDQDENAPEILIGKFDLQTIATKNIVPVKVDGGDNAGSQ